MTAFTVQACEVVLARLTLALGPRYGLANVSGEDLTATWYKALADCDEGDVAAAVDEWIRSQPKWPVPVQIREAAFTRQGRRRTPNASAEGFCLECHTPDLVAVPPWGRFMPRHEAHCPSVHPEDRARLADALASGAPVWYGGRAPRPQFVQGEAPALPPNA